MDISLSRVDKFHLQIVSLRLSLSLLLHFLRAPPLLRFDQSTFLPIFLTLHPLHSATLSVPLPSSPTPQLPSLPPPRIKMMTLFLMLTLTHQLCRRVAHPTSIPLRRWSKLRHFRYSPSRPAHPHTPSPTPLRSPPRSVTLRLYRHILHSAPLPPYQAITRPIYACHHQPLLRSVNAPSHHHSLLRLQTQVASLLLLHLQQLLHHSPTSLCLHQVVRD